MKRFIIPSRISKLVIVLFVSVLLFYMIYSLMNFEKTYTGLQTSAIKQVIDKALVQCYALEGQYPLKVEYIEKYGVILDDEKYIYHYEWYGGNIKPTVTVIERMR